MQLREFQTDIDWRFGAKMIDSALDHLAPNWTSVLSITIYKSLLLTSILPLLLLLLLHLLLSSASTKEPSKTDWPSYPFTSPPNFISNGVSTYISIQLCLIDPY